MCAVRRCDGLSSGIFAVLLVHISLENISQTIERRLETSENLCNERFLGGELSKFVYACGIENGTIYEACLDFVLINLE